MPAGLRAFFIVIVTAVVLGGLVMLVQHAKPAITRLLWPSIGNARALSIEEEHIPIEWIPEHAPMRSVAWE